MKVQKESAEIQKVIRSYAKAYGALQEYQETEYWKKKARDN